MHLRKVSAKRVILSSLDMLLSWCYMMQVSLCRNGIVRQVEGRLQRVTLRDSDQYCNFLGLAFIAQNRAQFYLNLQSLGQNLRFQNVTRQLQHAMGLVLFPTLQVKLQGKVCGVTPALKCYHHFTP